MLTDVRAYSTHTKTAFSIYFWLEGWRFGIKIPSKVNTPLPPTLIFCQKRVPSPFHGEIRKKIVKSYTP